MDFQLQRPEWYLLSQDPSLIKTNAAVELSDMSQYASTTILTTPTSSKYPGQNNQWSS
jgi:hypothetical protein